MKRRESERGSALVWSMGASLIVLLAITTLAGALAGQAESVRRLRDQGALADLQRAGREWALSGGRGTIELRAGSVELRRGERGDTVIVVTLRSGRQVESKLRR